jgi:hypothetical protein
MATITEEPKKFMAARLNTPLGAACVKTAGFRLDRDYDKRITHGVIVEPTITQAMLKGHPQGRMQNLLDAMQPTRITVRGHGWGIDGDAFVWTGSLSEFRRMWEVD